MTAASPETVAAFARTLAHHGAACDTWRPWLLRLMPGEMPAFTATCREHRIRMLDTIGDQLAELARVRFPAPGDRGDRSRFIADLVAQHDGVDHYGTWVCFPWDARVVHVLARDDYFDVVTSRNQDKITREEQQRLRTKRIGIVGLSVGGEIAVTLAQEHLCGSVALADFDRLDLSNLNRLNAGVDDLSVNKALLAARRIAKLDPYLDVTIYPQGISQSNAAAFLDGLDLLIDECDSLGTKHDLRVLARRRGLNVVYAADERGLLSVEPFAHVPDLPVFHGRIDGAPRRPRETAPPPLRELVEWLGGWQGISTRSRRSVGRVGTELCGYPQLASEPRLAAGQVAHVARRLLLGERLAPFFGYFDLAEQIRS